MTASDSGHPARQARVDRAKAVARVLWIVLVLNLGVAAVKLVIGWRMGALALFADGVHALLDASSNVVGLIGIFASSRPPDADHPYGHHRFETLAAVAIGMLIAAGMLEILHGIAGGLSHHAASSPNVSWSAAIVVASSAALNVLISRHERRKGLELRSELLLADAAHTWSDALATVVVLFSFVAVALGWRRADLVAAGIVAGFIGRTSFDILRTNLGILTDRARLDPHEVRAIAMEVGGVRGAHKIRSRGAADHVYVDLHVHVLPGLSIEEAHAVTHRVAAAIRNAFPAVTDVLIHTEPADGREADLSVVAPPS